jgi:hypothetical protein
MSEGPQAAGAAMLDAANAGTTSPVADNSNSPPNPQAAPVSNTPAAPVQTNQAPYAKQLEQIPEALRPMVEPVFKDWDTSVNRRFDEVHSRYAGYKEFLDAGVQPNQLREAVDLMKMVTTDPRRIYEALGEHFGFGQAQSGQGQVDEPEFDLGEEEQTQPFDLEKDPRFQQIAQQNEQITQLLQQQEQQRLEAEATQWLDAKTAQITEVLKEKGIEPDWDYIMGVAGAMLESGRTQSHDEAIEKATESFVAKVDQWRSRPSAGGNAPLVMPTNGGTPSTGLPPLNTAKDRKQLGSELLNAAFRNG